jgi:hypothetical protein
LCESEAIATQTDASFNHHSFSDPGVLPDRYAIPDDRLVSDPASLSDKGPIPDDDTIAEANVSFNRNVSSNPAPLAHLDILRQAVRDSDFRFSCQSWHMMNDPDLSFDLTR